MARASCLVVEGPQIGHRAAAAADDDDVDVRRQALDGGDDLRRRLRALHRAVGDQEVHPPAPAGDAQDVVQRGAARRGGEADDARKARQRSLARGVEQPLRWPAAP